MCAIDICIKVWWEIRSLHYSVAKLCITSGLHACRNTSQQYKTQLLKTVASSTQHIPSFPQSGCLSFWLAGVIAGNKSLLLSQLPLSDRDWLVSPSLCNSTKWVYITLWALSLLLALTAVCLQRLCVPFHVCHRLPCTHKSMQPPEYCLVPPPLCAHTHIMSLQSCALYRWLYLHVDTCNVKWFPIQRTPLVTNTFLHPSVLYQFTSVHVPAPSPPSPSYLHAFYPPRCPQRPLHLEK